MARTAITIQELDEIGGQEKIAEQVSTSEMKVLNDGRVGVKIVNGGISDLTVTVQSVSCSHGRIDNQTITIPNGDTWYAGRWTPRLFNQPLDEGQTYLNFDKTASITVHGIKI